MPSLSRVIASMLASLQMGGLLTRPCVGSGFGGGSKRRVSVRPPDIKQEEKYKGGFVQVRFPK